MRLQTSTFYRRNVLLPQLQLFVRARGIIVMKVAILRKKVNRNDGSVVFLHSFLKCSSECASRRKGVNTKKNKTLEISFKHPMFLATENRTDSSERTVSNAFTHHLLIKWDRQTGLPRSSLTLAPSCNSSVFCHIHPERV